MKRGGGILLSLVLLQMSAASSAVGAVARHCPEIAITDNWPEKLSQTGVYADLAGAKFSPDFFDYHVNIPLWASGAEKRKALCIPGEQPFAIPSQGWVDLPDGTIVVKEFSFALNKGKSRLETRLIYKRNGKWALKTYRWREDQREAVRVDLPETVTLDAPGSPRWEFMPSYRCEYCHYSEGRNRALGFTAAQLNDGKQIESWIANGLVGKDTVASALPKYPSLSDSTLTPYKKVRLYLDVNCSHCHRPGGMNKLMDFRFNTSLADMKIIDRTPSIWNFNLPDAKVIKPFSKEKSVLWLRMQINGSNSNHMPPLGATVPDQHAVDFVGKWIDSGALEDGVEKTVCGGS